ncbi:MAG: HD domain-containing protein [Anaerolineae bacterium]|nr:HD domain-containing protein [Anaerolineae bacterium]
MASVEAKGNQTVREARQARVLAVARQHRWEERHSRHVTALALSLFDQLAPVHGLAEDARALLQYTGYLHDIGYEISAKGHHKHSYRIIMAADWPGFADWEVQVMAAAARYHRKRLPRNGDRELAELDSERRGWVRLLAGILRVADGMDRTHLSMVRRVRAKVCDDRLQLTLVAGIGAELELYYALEKSDLLAETLGLRVKARLEPPAGDV